MIESIKYVDDVLLSFLKATHSSHVMSLFAKFSKTVNTCKLSILFVPPFALGIIGKCPEKS